MVNNKEWVIKYHGNLEKLLRGTGIMLDKINEHYAIIQARDKQITYLKNQIQIEQIEAAKPLSMVDHILSPGSIEASKKDAYDLSGSGVTTGWISHQLAVNYSYYRQDETTRLTCLHNGREEFNHEQIMTMENSGQGQANSMDLCIGNQGIAPKSQVILVNWEKDEFSTADAIRCVRFIIRRAKAARKPLVIYLPFDMSSESASLTRDIISHMILWGKIGIVSNLQAPDQKAKLNQDNKLVPIYSSCGPLTVGVLVLIMEWNIVKENNPELYGQLLRTYYIRQIEPLLGKENKESRSCSGKEIKGYRTLELAYELAPENAIIDIFAVYNSLSDDPAFMPPQGANLYPLAFPYFGIRGTATQIKRYLSGYLDALVTGSLAYILGREPIEIKTTDFKYVSIRTESIGLSGAGTLIGIIDTGIDYTHPAFIDSAGKTRILSIWDQTVGDKSPYGYGTVYSQEEINWALQSPDPHEVLPHQDLTGSGTILAGIAAGYSIDKERTYKGVAPEAEIIAVKLVPASPQMQKIYHDQYNPLGFSALDIARGFEFLAILANQHQKPMSICLPMGTNSGPHDGTSILETIITSYAENPGISMVLAAGEEANKGHHASGHLKEENKQQILLTIPKGQGGFLIEIWATFGDQIEVSLTSPKIGQEDQVTVLLNKAQTHRIANSSIWSQGSKIDTDTGCQVIRFRLDNPLVGQWTIGIKGIVVIEGRYDIWIPKTGMILPQTMLSPPDPFTTIYGTSAAAGIITVSAYDRNSLSATPSSGRGFARDGRVKPDFMVPAVNMPGPLPGNRWGLVSGTDVASAITAGLASLIYEDQSKQGEVFSNTLTMKSILVGQVKREETVTYPSPTRGYGLLDTGTSLY